MYFNSFDLQYKSHFGAVSQGNTICFYVDGGDATDAYMMIRCGEGEFEYRQMQKSMDSRFFISVTFDDVGVYFYRFKLITPNGEKQLYRAPNGSSTFTAPFDWQQTVYSKDYSTPEYIKGGVIYQIFPDRFYKADVELPPQYEDRVYVDWNAQPCYINGNKGLVINNDYFGGNLAGITEKLPYIKSLGVSVIYLNPIFEAHSNHRYNTANYMKIDPTLGDENDFKVLCDSAHKLNIAIVLDGVFSHTGSDSIYFNKENRYDSVGAYNSEQSSYYSWYGFKQWPNDYHSWWGFETLPEVNENDEKFCEYITGENGVIDYWMSKGANGFRLDVADELPDEFIKKIRKAIKRNNENGFLIGEVWEDASNKVSYSAQRQYLWGEELDSVMNYPFANEILRFVRYKDGIKFMDKIMQIIENYPKCALDVLMNLLSTHDTERLITALAGEPSNGRGREWQCRVSLTPNQRELGIKLCKIAAVLQYTLPGVPSLYYGDEIATEGYRDPFNRASFKWDKVSSDNSMLEFYKTLGILRKNCLALKSGEFIKAQYDYNLVSYLRVAENSEIFVMANPTECDAWFWLLPGWENDDVLIGENVIENGKILVKSYSASVIGRGDWTKQFLNENSNNFRKE